MLQSRGGKSLYPPPPVINNDEPLLYLKSSGKNNSCELNRLVFREASENIRQIF